MESHNNSTKNILLENIAANIPMSVILTTLTKYNETAIKSSATNPCKSSLETKLITIKSFLFEQFYLTKKWFQDIKYTNHETKNSSYVTKPMEHMEYPKEKNYSVYFNIYYII